MRLRGSLMLLAHPHRTRSERSSRLHRQRPGAFFGDHHPSPACVVAYSAIAYPAAKRSSFVVLYARHLIEDDIACAQGDVDADIPDEARTLASSKP